MSKSSMSQCRNGRKNERSIDAYVEEMHVVSSLLFDLRKRLDEVLLRIERERIMQEENDRDWFRSKSEGHNSLQITISNTIEKYRKRTLMAQNSLRNSLLIVRIELKGRDAVLFDGLALRRRTR